ncbi:unnamed protein product [Phytomonas sp. Hart1]|nr:unnamed protein product [Phytomonas sp. Hart1]|eukprot:CCW67397.1 unnamed protein product [Phytomonas sp. isolate Hart1]
MWPTLLFLRPRSFRSSKSHPLRSLRRRLTDLQRGNRQAESFLRERRRLLAFCGSSRPGPKGERPQATSWRSHSPLHLLPRNPELESAIAFSLTENRDARAELELIRRLIGGALLSLASPVGRWDPLDVKPQIFALDRFLALPVFTSIEYLRLFCQRFGFTARDPAGVLWAAGEGESPHDAAEGPDERSSVFLSPPGAFSAPPSVSSSSSRSNPVAEGVDSTEVLFTTMNDKDEADPRTAKAKCESRTPVRGVSPVGPKSPKRFSAGRGKFGCRRLRNARRRIKPPRPAARTARRANTPLPEEDPRADATRKAFWEAVARVRPFKLKQATPLPIFGPFTRNHFIGYFADVDTLLHNASIVSEKVDIILNPFSPLEVVLAREATDRVLHHDQLLAIAYGRVERELCREFSGFISTHCPEVRTARSACLPRPLSPPSTSSAPVKTFTGENPLQNYRERTRILREAQFSKGVNYDLVILLQSEDIAETYRRLRWGKHQCLLLGHADLEVLPEEMAAPHVREAARVFFTREDAPLKVNYSSSDLPLHGFRKVGRTHTVNVAQSAESFYHDPTNAYTEAHAVFTEELKFSRGNEQ